MFKLGLSSSPCFTMGKRSSWMCLVPSIHQSTQATWDDLCGEPKTRLVSVLDRHHHLNQCRFRMKLCKNLQFLIDETGFSSEFRTWCSEKTHFFFNPHLWGVSTSPWPHPRSSQCFKTGSIYAGQPLRYLKLKPYFFQFFVRMTRIITEVEFSRMQLEKPSSTEKNCWKFNKNGGLKPAAVHVET